VKQGPLQVGKAFLVKSAPLTRIRTPNWRYSLASRPAPLLAPKYWPFILLFVNTLKNFGFLAIIYYASVISIGKDYYEAAELDGAGKMKQIWYITLPFLKPTIIMMVLLAVGKVFYSDFGLFYQVPQNSGALFSVTNTIDTYVYRSLIQLGDVGMASAAGVYQSIVGFILVFLTNLLVRKISPSNALF
jgi:putative aldouronate transport system permease protein